MKKNFGFDVEFNKLILIARSLWMGFGHGEGELEIEDQGRLNKSRFSQETEAIGQQAPRIGDQRPKLRFTQRVSSAGSTMNSDSTPHFFSSNVQAEIIEEKVSDEKALQTIEANQEKILEFLHIVGAADRS